MRSHSIYIAGPFCLATRRQREQHASGWQQSRGCLREGRGHLTPVRLIRPKEILLCRILPRTLCFTTREGSVGRRQSERGRQSSAFLQVSDNAHMPRDLPLVFLNRTSAYRTPPPAPARTPTRHRKSERESATKMRRKMDGAKATALLARKMSIWLRPQSS